MHWIIFLKMRNSLIYSRKLIRGHKITRQLSEYKKHIWTIVFLMLKLIPVSVLLGICRKCKVCSIVSFLETGGMGFSYHILWLRKWRALEFKRLVPNCPNGVFLPAQRLPPSGGAMHSHSRTAGGFPCPCRQDCPPRVWGCCSLRPHGLCLWGAGAAHSEQKFWRFHGEAVLDTSTCLVFSRRICSS